MKVEEASWPEITNVPCREGFEEVGVWEVGTKVFVFSGDMKEFLGEGEIVELVTLTLRMRIGKRGFWSKFRRRRLRRGLVISRSHPKIRLRDGRVLLGIECWWIRKPCEEVRCGECVFYSVCSERKELHREVEG